MNKREAVISGDIFKENKKRFDEIYSLVCDIPEKTTEELKKMYFNLCGSEAPQATHDWLKEAVIRKTQRKYYEDNNIEIPSRVVKNDNDFFEKEIPQKENKKIKTKEKTKVTKKRKKDVDFIIRWKKGSNVEIIAKQRKEHMKKMFEIIYDAGENGILASELEKETPKRLSSLDDWEKSTPRSHVNWIVKKFTDNVEREELEDE